MEQKDRISAQMRKALKKGGFFLPGPVVSNLEKWIDKVKELENERDALDAKLKKCRESCTCGACKE